MDEINYTIILKSGEHVEFSSFNDNWISEFWGLTNDCLDRDTFIKLSRNGIVNGIVRLQEIATIHKT